MYAGDYRSPDGRRLGIGHYRGKVRVRSLVPTGPDPLKPLSTAALESTDDAWRVLGSTFTDAAYQAQWRMLESPDEALRTLSRQLKAADAEFVTMLKQRIDDLTRGADTKWRSAQDVLQRAGHEVMPMLRQAFRDANKPDAVKRLRGVLTALATAEVPSEYLRESRAVHVLEMFATPEALRVLRELAAGPPGATLTEDAKAALRRLERLRELALNR